MTFPKNLMLSEALPLNSDLKCPVCEETIPVMATVRIKDGSVRHAGTAGFREPILVTNIDAEVVDVVISHICKYTEPVR